MLELLATLETASEPITRSGYLPPGLPEGTGGSLLDEALGAGAYPGDLPVLASRSATGAAVFRCSAGGYLVLPPFPLPGADVFDGYEPGPLRLLLQKDWGIGLVIVHLGEYAVAYCQGERIVSSKAGRGLVHGRHKKGGSSQQRFQRRRDNQAREFLERVCLHAREHLEPRERTLEYVAFAGPRQTVLALRKQCPFLGSPRGFVLPLLDVPSAGREVLPGTVTRIWSSRITEWRL